MIVLGSTAAAFGLSRSMATSGYKQLLHIITPHTVPVVKREGDGRFRFPSVGDRTVSLLDNSSFVAALDPARTHRGETLTLREARRAILEHRDPAHTLLLAPAGRGKTRRNYGRGRHGHSHAADNTVRAIHSSQVQVGAADVYPFDVCVSTLPLQTTCRLANVPFPARLSAGRRLYTASIGFQGDLEARGVTLDGDALKKVIRDTFPSMLCVSARLFTTQPYVPWSGARCAPVMVVTPHGAKMPHARERGATQGPYWGIQVQLLSHVTGYATVVQMVIRSLLLLQMVRPGDTVCETQVEDEFAPFGMGEAERHSGNANDSFRGDLPLIDKVRQDLLQHHVVWDPALASSDWSSSAFQQGYQYSLVV